MAEQKHATRAIQGGANADLLWEIRAVMRRLPDMTVKWVKLKAHRKQEAETIHVVSADGKTPQMVEVPAGLAESERNRIV